jgi:hypothetical protein
MQGSFSLALSYPPRDCFRPFFQSYYPFQSQSILQYSKAGLCQSMHLSLATKAYRLSSPTDTGLVIFYTHLFALVHSLYIHRSSITAIKHSFSHRARFNSITRMHHTAPQKAANNNIFHDRTFHKPSHQSKSQTLFIFIATSLQHSFQSNNPL